jgi:protein-arginine kinase activator protein McsA
MLCAKCQKQEATVHVTTILHGGKEETIRLCQDCDTDTARFPTFDPSQVETLPIIARKCEFCGEEAFSAKALADGRTIYWCFNCQAEYRRTFTQLFIGEHAEFMECVKTRSPFPTSFSPQQFQTWAADADQRVVQIMKERRQKV